MADLVYFSAARDVPDRVAGDADLVTRVAAGDEAAVTELWARYGRAVTGTCRVMLGDRSAVDAAERETLRRIRSRASAYLRHGVTPAEWVIAIAAEAMEATAPGSVAETPDAGTHAAEIAGVRRLRGAFAQLPEPERSAVALTYFAGLAHSQVALALGRPLATVTAALSRGLAQLASSDGRDTSHADLQAQLPAILWLRPVGSVAPVLRAHVSVCEECRALLAGVERIEAMLRAAAVVDDPPTELSRVANDDPPAGSIEPRRRTVTARVAVAGGIAVAAGALAVVLVRASDQPTRFEAARTVAFASPVSPVRGRLEFAEPRDGKQSFRLVASGLDVRFGSTYELWLAGPQRVSAGRFRPNTEGGGDLLGVVPKGIGWTSFTVTGQRAPGAPVLPIVSAAL